jgi:hypothetical protein
MRAMDDTERAVEAYLRSQGYLDIVFEPDGNVSPDFLVDGRIAVEARRLNQNEVGPDGYRGLEETAIPTQASIRKLLPRFGPSRDAESWYVFAKFRRPLPANWQSRVNRILEGFRVGAERQTSRLTVAPRFRLDLLRAGRSYDDFFVFGGYADGDTGGFVVEELAANLRICVFEKTRKVALVRSKYPVWWLILVDHISFGLDADDRAALRQLATVDHSWDKIIVIGTLEVGGQPLDL